MTARELEKRGFENQGSIAAGQVTSHLFDLNRQDVYWCYPDDKPEVDLIASWGDGLLFFRTISYSYKGIDDGKVAYVAWIGLEEDEAMI